MCQQGGVTKVQAGSVSDHRENPALPPSASFFCPNIIGGAKHPLGTGKRAEIATQPFLVHFPEARGGPLAPTKKEETPGYERTFLILLALGCQGDGRWTQVEELVTGSYTTFRSAPEQERCQTFLVCFGLQKYPHTCYLAGSSQQWGSCYSHFIEEETEAGKVLATCPQWRSG